MKRTVLFLLALPFFLTSVRAQTNYTWNGATSTAWTTSTNWTSASGGVPTSADNVTIVSTSNNPVLSANTTVNNLTMTSGTLKLATYDITVGGAGTFSGGTMQNGKLAMTAGTAKFLGTDMDVAVDVNTSINNMENTVFRKKATLESSTTYYGGGNVFKDTTVITSNWGGNNDLRLGVTNPDTFLAPLTINLEAASQIRLAYNSAGNYFADDVTLNNHSGNTGRGFLIGASSSSGTYFNGDIILNVSTGSGYISFSSGTNQHNGKLLIGAEGYHSGVLTLRAYTQLTTDAVDLSTLQGSSTISLGNGLTLEGDLTCATVNTTIGTGCRFKGEVNIPQLWVWNGATFDKKATITLENVLSTGGNVFKDTTIITSNWGGNNELRLGVTVPDTFLAPLTINLEAASQIRLAYNSTGSYFADDVTLNNHSGNSGRGFIIGPNSTSGTYFNGDITLNVSSGSGYISFSSGTNQHNGKLLIGAEGYHSGVLTLRAYTQLTTDAVDLSALDGSSTIALGNGLTLEGDLTCASVNTTIGTNCRFKGDVTIPRVWVWNAAIFEGKATLILPKVFSVGGNVFKDTTVITSNWGGYNELRLGFAVPDTFLAPVTFNLEGASVMKLAYNTTGNYFGSDVTLNNHSGHIWRGIFLGGAGTSGATVDGDIIVNVSNGSGLIVLSAGTVHNGLLTVGSEGYHSGQLTFGAYTQTASGTIDLSSLDNGSSFSVQSGADITADLLFSGGRTATLSGATFRGNVDLESPSLPVTNCDFYGITSLKKTGGVNNLNSGNMFRGATTIENASSGNYVYWGYNTPDTFLNALTLINRSSQPLWMNYTSTGQYGGDITLDGDSAKMIRFGSSTAGRLAVFNGSTDQTLNVLNPNLNVQFYRAEVNRPSGRLKLMVI